MASETEGDFQDAAPTGPGHGYPASAIYQQLTAEFNVGRTRAIISSGQACVMYRLSLVSKDGDWIVAEDDADLAHVLAVLERRGARYRLGAPLSVAWLSGGWSSHLEFSLDGLRIRTDFVSRPPRVAAERLVEIWRAAAGHPVPVLAIPDLIAIKRTLRERDYPIIGALGLRLTDPEQILRWSIAPQALLATIASYPHLAERLAHARPVLATLAAQPSQAREALLQERLACMDADRQRIERYRRALTPWDTRWQALAPQLQALPLREAHTLVVNEARRLLPTRIEDS